jgi:acyl carrier protein
MARQELQQRVINVVADQLGVPVGDVRGDSRFVEDLGTDSLDTVELVMAFEEEFDVNIADEEAEKLTTVDSVVDFLERAGK